MAYIKQLFDKNFLEYASYVIRDRAIPDAADGLKPVQRRILHTLFEMDDGKFHKVANVVGQCMKYHPHGDASIYSALVVLANKDLFIERQGNFGNMYTGDGASAARYIECRITPMAKEILHNPAITHYTASYDGRNREPVLFRSKLATVLILGAEGIAVGMSTKILPHNIREVIEAQKACLEGKPFSLYPDFPTGGLIDVSEYKDGLGKIISRARLDTSDPKRIVITELPAGSTTESLINSIENAARSGRLKIASINDYTADKVEIEIKLQRGIYTQDVVDALYAFSDCELSVSCNLLVINNNMPQVMTVSELIRQQTENLLAILKDELELEHRELTDKLFLRTLERIFIEERIYKRIEEMKTEAAVTKAVLTGFEPFAGELIRPIKKEDIDHLLKIPIRRISLYDISKNKKEVNEIRSRLREIDRLLKNLKTYAAGWLEGTLQKLDPHTTKRRTEIASFNAVDVKTVVARDIPLRYDTQTGYLGTAIASGNIMLTVSPYDKILFIKQNGSYLVTSIPEKLFVGKGLWYCGLADKEEMAQRVFTIVYRDPQSRLAYIKRCRIEQFLSNREYSAVPEGMEVLLIEHREACRIRLTYSAKPRLKIHEEIFKAEEFGERGVRAQGVRLASREVDSAEALCTEK